MDILLVLRDLRQRAPLGCLNAAFGSTPGAAMRVCRRVRHRAYLVSLVAE